MLMYASIEGYNDFLLNEYNTQNNNCNDTDMLVGLHYAENKVLSWVNGISNCCDMFTSVENTDILANAIYMLCYDYLNVDTQSDQTPVTNCECSSFLYLKRNGFIWA